MRPESLCALCSVIDRVADAVTVEVGTVREKNRLDRGSNPGQPHDMRGALDPTELPGRYVRGITHALQQGLCMGLNIQGSAVYYCTQEM